MADLDEARINRLANKLRHYDHCRHHATHADVHAHVDRIVSNHKTPEIHAAMDRAGMTSLGGMNRTKTVKALHDIHAASIDRKLPKPV